MPKRGSGDIPEKFRKGADTWTFLQQARAEIDTVDAEMAALFERRMRAVADVVRYKAETGKPVFDAAREAAVLDKNTARHPPMRRCAPTTAPFSAMP